MSEEFKETIKKLLKREGWSSVISAIVFLLIGILIVNNPDTIIATVSYILGGFLVIGGLFKIISYFIEKGNLDFENYDLVYGIMILVLGIIFITHVTILESIFSIVIAIWLIYEGLIRGTSSMKLKKYEVKAWWVVLVSALLMIFLGIYILAVPNIIVITLGIIMIVYAVMDVVDGLIFVANINKLWNWKKWTMGTAFFVHFVYKYINM